MKKLILFFMMILFATPAIAFEECELVETQTIQQKIDNCGFKILNANRINRRVIFIYDTTGKKSILKTNSSVLKREVIVYDNSYKYFENDDEMAAFISREIALAVRSYDGVFNGFLRSLQMKASPKKFEMVADKRAVDYMVTAGYQPVALITYIQKTCPQQKQDTLSFHNLTSKRLATIYEYIYTKYPYYLKNNPYLYTQSYQNFLLTSMDNRKKFEEQLRNSSKRKVKYE